SASQLVIWQMGARGADRAQMAALLHRFDNVAGSSIVFSIGGLASVVGVVLLSIALYRSRTVPAWASVGVAAGTVLNIVGFVVAREGEHLLARGGGGLLGQHQHLQLALGSRHELRREWLELGNRAQLVRRAQEHDDVEPDRLEQSLLHPRFQLRHGPARPAEH